MPTSVRLDPETEHILESLARQRAQTKSQVLRQAIRSLAKSEGRATKGASPFERVADLVGSIGGGPPDLSSRTGEKLRRLLEGRRTERP